MDSLRRQLPEGWVIVGGIDSETIFVKERMNIPWERTVADIAEAFEKALKDNPRPKPLLEQILIGRERLWNSRYGNNRSEEPPVLPILRRVHEEGRDCLAAKVREV